MRIKYKQTLTAISDFLDETFKESSTNIIRKEAFDINDNFLLLLFGDLLGLPNPFAYYALELLPFLADEIEGWERRVLGRKILTKIKLCPFI
ncbi:MAG: hypothetical protein ACE5LC_04370 [Candidatus Aminicenantales bacterium]